MTDKKPKKKVGRPSGFSQEIADTICQRLAEGESLRTICKDADMPCTTAVKQWMRKEEYKDFTSQYARAREEQADFYAAEIIEISDGVMEGSTDVNHARLRVDSRKWYAGKLRPKKYGDTSRIALGGDGDNPTPIKVEDPGNQKLVTDIAFLFNQAIREKA